MGYYIYIQTNNNIYDYENVETWTNDVLIADKWLRDGVCEEICALDALSLELVECFSLNDVEGVIL